MHKKREIKVAASIIAADFSHLQEEIQEVEEGGVDFLHLDIMDGIYVPQLTFGPILVHAIRKWTKLPLDVHLMVKNPLRYIEEFTKAGADFITFHPDGGSPVEITIAKIKQNGVKPGLAISPPVAVETIVPYLDILSMVLVMSVNPGYAGQMFLKEILPKLEKLQLLQKGRNFSIAIDGGINEETAKEAKLWGVAVLVSASYLFRAQDKRSAINSLKN